MSDINVGDEVVQRFQPSVGKVLKYTHVNMPNAAVFVQWEDGRETLALERDLKRVDDLSMSDEAAALDAADDALRRFAQRVANAANERGYGHAQLVAALAAAVWWRDNE